MKMMSRTSTTSTSGVTFISGVTPRFCLPLGASPRFIAIASALVTVRSPGLRRGRVGSMSLAHHERHSRKADLLRACEYLAHAPVGELGVGAQDETPQRLGGMLGCQRRHRTLEIVLLLVDEVLARSRDREFHGIHRRLDLGIRI